MKALTVYIKPVVSDQEGYSDLIGTRQFSKQQQKLEANSIRYLYITKDNVHYCHVFTKDIVSFIERNYSLVDEVDWSSFKITDAILKETDVESISAFCNSSFWKYATNKITPISSKFIKSHLYEINFGEDEEFDDFTKINRLSSANLSLSQNKALSWSIELLEEFQEHWNWSLLGLNNAVRWDDALIHHFHDYVDFESISNNTRINWTAELISAFAEKWDWSKLSVNPSLPWSYEFIKQFESFWLWKPENKLLQRQQTYLRGDLYSHLKPNSISHNKMIRWTGELIEFIGLIDVWSVAANAYMSQDFIAQVHSKLNEKREIYTYWERHLSYDYYPSEQCTVELSGWDLITQNKEAFYN